MYKKAFCVLLCLTMGCGADPKAVLVPIENIPENLMTIAHEKLPGVTFEQAVIRGDGRYEISGKDGRGKVREIELSRSGEILEIE